MRFASARDHDARRGMSGQHPPQSPAMLMPMIVAGAGRLPELSVDG
jgi:hypothetical protein